MFRRVVMMVVVVVVMSPWVVSCARAWRSSLYPYTKTSSRRTLSSMMLLSHNVNPFHPSTSSSSLSSLSPQQLARFRSSVSSIPSFSRSSSSLSKIYHRSQNNNKRSFVPTFLSSSDELDDASIVDEQLDAATQHTFFAGDKIQVEVISFGPLGASVDVIAKSHAAADIIDDSQPPLAQGLILQKEIAYFREARNQVDVVRGEVLPAYVEAVREDGKINIGLRVFGGQAKAEEVGQMILRLLHNESDDGTLPIGDKSLPEDIADVLPGVSKASFKKAVAALYKQGLVKPSPFSIYLLQPKPTPPTTATKEEEEQEKQPTTRQRTTKQQPPKSQWINKKQTKQNDDGSSSSSSSKLRSKPSARRTSNPAPDLQK